ncbi:hypothetical protein CLCY_1c01660 [Clostridium cylindrosporum DSM 605]|uniref:Uncharacterized protein n=1 Tax=Clostridium cylindrosporum DSM 605 TaxID=1121307 RepID=A0A0J8D539_CLOCY|nr:hypothetical protein CLCY_1c01660 [Clostridium cylindrosporum DSM 605]
MPTIPIFALPFIATMFLVPILSIEGITPWFLFIFFSYKIVKTSNKAHLTNKELFKKTLIYFSICLFTGILYNICINEATTLVIKKLL